MERSEHKCAGELTPLFFSGVMCSGMKSDGRLLYRGMNQAHYFKQFFIVRAINPRSIPYAG
jgi:hypothetical protein